MSSSNPFRQRPVNTDYTSQSAIPDRGAPLSYSSYLQEDPPPKASKSTKTVRISSPPRSPDLSHTSPAVDELSPHVLASQEIKSYHDGISSTPNQRNQERASVSEESDTGSDNDEVEDMAGTLVQSRSTTNMPYNPFSRTLATMEGMLPVGKDISTEPADITRQTEGHTLRPAMDVNTFKNLLMTGKPSTNTSDVPKPKSITLADNSSSTDTSSVSRQSIVEPISNETPRTSYERSISEEDIKPDTLPKRMASKKVKPPPPRHRYGKSVGPQIVSFADFSPLAEDTSLPNTLSSPSSKTMKRPSSEYHRPVPPVPTKRDISPNQIEPSPRQSLDSDTEQSVQRKPPPPPLARRSSHRNPMSPPARPRADTASSRISLKEDNESIAESTTSSTKIAPPPPPPPARRAGTAHSASRSTDEITTNTLARTPSIKSPPPLPAARKRAGSNLSSTSTPSNLTITPSSTMLSAPPPPPPRRTSSKSSIEFTPPRRSNDLPRGSFDSERRPSVSSSMRRIPITEEPAAESPGAEAILADMEAFQREIDALMRKGSGSSEIGKGKS